MSVNHLTVLPLIIAVLVTAVVAGSDNQQQCPIRKNSLIRLSIKNRRNESGHWNSQIGFEPANGWKQNQTDEWTLNVDQSTSTSCDGEEGFSIIATIAQGSLQIRPDREIPAGYDLFPSVGYYKYHSVSVIWAQARQTCKEEGAHLIIVNSEKEANVIRQYFDRYPKEKITNPDAYESIWIGAYEQGGKYYTIDGEPLDKTEFTRWHPGQPADPGSNDCLSLQRIHAALDDVPCTRKAPFVCEPLDKTEFTRWHPGQPADPGSNDCLSLQRIHAALDDVPCTRKAPFVCEFTPV